MIEQSIRIFRTAARVRNFTEAGALLGMTQSNVTQQLAKLERRLRLPLFRRNGRTMELTNAGQVLLDECEHLFEVEKDILRKLRNAEKHLQNYSVGGTLTAGSYLLIGMNTAFSRENPNVSLQLKVNSLAVLLPQLSAGELELVLTDEPYDRQYLLSIPYCLDRLFPVYAPGVLRTGIFSLEEYIRSGRKIVLDGFGGCVFRVFRHFLQERHLPFPEDEQVVEASSSEVAKQLVQAGQGIGIFSSLAVENECKAGVLKMAAFAEGQMSRPVDFIYLPTANKQFVRDFTSFCLGHRGASLGVGN